jgi:8-oxo-dGTP pyrophosphatase MutT (NUDIX family)
VRGDELLLVKRADTLAWTPVTGIIDPGEQPAVAARREVLEEADVHVSVDRLASIGVSEPMTYQNGDEAQYLDLTFRCSWIGGDPAPADGENVEAAWFPLTSRPRMSDDMERRVAAALADEAEARFES